MPITYTFHGNAVVVTVEGILQPGQLIETITSAYNDPQFMLKTSVLVDVRQSAANPTSAEVQQASRVIVGRRPPGHVGRWAILTSREPMRFGNGRMAALTMESLGVPMGVFTEIEPALDYLRAT